MVFLTILCNTIQPLRVVKTCQTVNFTVTRAYARWTSRRPVAIVNENELFDCDDTTQAQNSSAIRNARRSKRKEKPPPAETVAAQEREKNNIFTKLKDNEKIVMSLMTKLRSRKKREKCNEVIIEGHRLIKDALKAGLVPSTILYNNPDDVKQFNFPANVVQYKVPYQTLQLWSSLTTCPGLLGIFKTPEVQKTAVAENVLPVTIICDNIREPGNLGSIMRAAAGVGCEKLILMKGCVDLWDPKVLRSAAGTHFRLPIHSLLTWDELPSVVGEDCHIFVADSNFGDEFISNYSPAILQSSLEVFDIDPEALKTQISNQSGDTELMLPKNKKMMKELMLRIPIVPYYSIDYTRKECVIIISGETEGLSFDSFKFLTNQKGIRINIPLAEGVDSLNAGVALGIVTFEIRRQFMKKQSTL